MAKSNDLYDVKICVRSSVKLLEEIKDLLERNPNRERLFRRTVFGPWLDILSHDNDNHLMHYVLQHQIYVSKISSDWPSLIFYISDHWLQFGRKEFCLITGFRFGIMSEKHKKSSPFCERLFPEKITKKGVKRLKSIELLGGLRLKKTWLGLSDMDSVMVCLLIVAELVFMGKEDRNCIPKHILSLVEDFDSWNVYPWGEYIYGYLESYTNSKKWWSKKDNVLPRALAWLNVTKFEKNDYNRLFRPDSNPNLELYATPVEKHTGWFIASIQFINGLVDEDLNVSQDDGVDVVSGNCVDLQHNSVSAVSVLSANSHEGLNKTRVANNKMLLLEGGDGFFYSEGGATNPESNKDKPPMLADVLDEVHALRKEVSLVKFDNARISKLERILNDNFMFRNDISPNGNHNAVNQGLSGSANHLMSTCSRPNIDNGEVSGHIIGIHKADGKNDSLNGNQNGVKKGLSSSANDPLSTCSGAHILDGKVVGALIGIHKSTCSSPDMDNGKVVVAGMGIHKADRQNDIPNANDNVVNQGIIISANDPMPSTLDVLVQGFDFQKNHLGIDVLQHDTHVDCSVAKLNDHPTTDIGVKAVPVDEFADDYMDMLNDEESIPNYSLDDMKLQDEEEKLISTPAPVNHQQVDELIDVHEDKTTMLQKNLKDVSNKSQYVNVVKEDYKPCLGMVFANVKAKRKKCGLERNYVLRSVKERKKRLAMSLDSSFGQQATTTPAPPKTISRSVNGDFIAPPEFLEDVSGEPKMRSINELMTLEVFVEQLSRPHNCIRDKVTLPDGLSDFINMQDPPEYRFPWGYQDIVVDREFWLVLACLDNIQQGWLKDTHLDLWIDLMWYFREPDADWAMVSPHFLTCTLGGSMIDYYSNGVRYPVAWRDVEKVYFPVNEPKKHWCLAELHISTGVVTFYDSLGWVCGNRRPWWRTMKRTLPQQLTLYLNEHGVLQSKGIAVETYEIKYMFPKVVRQADDYGDCGVWIMNRLPVKSLLQFHTVSKSWKSYNDSSVFFFKYGVHDNLIHTPALTNLQIVNLKPIGFGVRLDNLDPTVVTISYLSSVEGNWSVYVFTRSSLRWDQLDINRLPRKSIRFKRSTQAVVGQFIYWVGHERILADSGDSYKHYLLVSFDMINHCFQVIDIPNVVMRGLSVPLYVSNLQNSLVLSGNIPIPEYYVFVCFQLSIDGGSITSTPTIMTMPSNHFLKLLGFNNHDLPIVEAATVHIMGHTIIHCIVQANIYSGFESGGLMSDVDLVKMWVVYEELEYGVLLPNDVNYSNLVRYVKKKFKVGDANQISLSYNIGSISLNIIDDDDVRFFVNEVSGEEEAFIYEIALKCLKEGYQCKVRNSCPERYAVECVQPDCYWYIFTRRMKKCTKWRITNINDNHACSKTQFNPYHHNVTSKLLSKLILPKVRDVTRVYRPKDIAHDVNMEWNIYVSYKKAWRGKHIALASSQGCPIESFAQFPFYCYNLKKENEGTVTDIETDDKGRFKMCFIGFGVAIKSFLCYMRPLIIIDGAHLKGTYLGTNLVAVGMDGNN
ncbi:phospholipase-like protein [Tanacetum coccineum]